jgi:hypothetical protein
MCWKANSFEAYNTREMMMVMVRVMVKEHGTLNIIQYRWMPIISIAARER